MTVDLRGLKPGDPCPRCKEPVRDLGGTNAVWCRNDCDRVPAPVVTEKTEPITPSPFHYTFKWVP